MLFGCVKLLLYLCIMDNALLYSMTPLSSFTKKELRVIASLCMEYCKDNLGVNRRRRKDISISIVKNPSSDIYYGEYCPTKNVVRIFYDEVPTLGQFTATFIHEYTHSLQPIATKYSKLMKKYGYDNHPHEIEARDNELIYNRRVLSYLRKRLK